MAELYKHIRIKKEELINDRRTRQYKIPAFKRGDLATHGQKLGSLLQEAIFEARKQNSSNANRFVLKLEHIGMLDIQHLNKHGVEFISQEEAGICIAFANESGLVQFANHLSLLGLDDSKLTYKQILTALESVGNWTRQDRESWAVKYYGLPDSPLFRLDVELWPIEVSNHPMRARLVAEFGNWLTGNGIHQIDLISLDSLLLYRLEVSSAQADLLFEHSDVRYIDLLPQSGIQHAQLNIDISDIPNQLPSPNQDSARICILDSGINTNHPLLRSAVAENTSYISGVAEDDDVGHGTAIAGIALYGDIEACAESNYWKPDLWLFSGKILYLDKHTGEAQFDPRTIETVLSSAVHYFYTVHGCRIFNLSIGNRNAPYDSRHIKGVAYLLDKLARECNVLFVVSAGNFNGSDTPPVPRESWRAEYPEYLTCPESIIIDPAPALNVLTVGSVARHNAHINEQRYPEIHALSPASDRQPSPFTRHGPSIKGAIKPDVVATGGNLASPMRQEGGQWKADARGMGVLTLHHDFIGKTLLKEISGTSFAAPYIAHLAGRILNEYPGSSANLLRAMLVNHAVLPQQAKEIFTDELKDNHKEKYGSNLFHDVLGYGLVDTDTLFRSSESAVVLFSEEVIEHDSHQFFELPLPDSFLRSNRAKRELRVSLAYSPPVRTTRLDYVATKIFFRLVKGSSLEEVQKSFNHETQLDTEVRNDDAISNRSISAQARGKGTVQSSTWEFKQLSPKVKWFIVVTRQDRLGWGNELCNKTESYALVVTVTDRDNAEAQLYAQIQSRIEVQEQERVRV
ncbi:S8 family peptidase [Undibacterium sp. Ji50W]|uniref:S8 family peptidase n=1 Tax=Undibacterium sp. Ji50W TaxID=3413041 RepID=UPI003BF4519F